MAAMSFDRLAQVEMQIVMQHCDKVTLLRLARCSRITLAASSHRFAWRSLPPLHVRCDSSLELSSRVTAWLLRFAHLFAFWNVRFRVEVIKRIEEEDGSQTAEQQSALLAAEVAALTELPGLRRLEVRGRSVDVALFCSALLAVLNDRGALADPELDLFLDEGELRHADYSQLTQFVARSRALAEIRIVNNYLTLDDARLLADAVRQSQSLATLSLTGKNLCDEAAIALADGVARCSSLTDLRLSCRIGDVGMEALAEALEQNDNSISSLGLSYNRFDGAGSAALARLLASDRCVIERLNLSHCTISDEGAQSLAEGLRTNRTINQLQFIKVRNIGAEGTAAVAAALQTNRHIPLRHLDLAENHVDAEGTASLAAFLRVNLTLEKLNLRSCKLSDAALAALATGLPAAHSLRELRLGDGFLGLLGATALTAGVGACPSLTLLDLGYNQSLGDAAIAALAPALACLRILDATFCGLTGASAASLALLVQPGRKLHTLHLSGNTIGSVGVIALASTLHPSSPLRSLHLCCCRVDAEGAAALGEALRPGWAGADLNLDSNFGICDDGAHALASAMEQRDRPCSLRTLGLSSCNLTVASALPLVRAAAVVPSFRSLSLYGNPANAGDGWLVLLAARGAQPYFQLEL